MAVVEKLSGASIEEVGRKLPSEPCYLLYVHKVQHKDGRVHYPMSFILFLPEGITDDARATYARPVATLCGIFKVDKHFELEDASELDEQWLVEQLHAIGAA